MFLVASSLEAQKSIGSLEEVIYYTSIVYQLLDIY